MGSALLPGRSPQESLCRLTRRPPRLPTRRDRASQSPPSGRRRRALPRDQRAPSGVSGTSGGASAATNEHHHVAPALTPGGRTRERRPGRVHRETARCRPRRRTTRTARRPSGRPWTARGRRGGVVGVRPQPITKERRRRGAMSLRGVSRGPPGGEGARRSSVWRRRCLGMMLSGAGWSHRMM